jgi:hypothetical protein
VAGTVYAAKENGSEAAPGGGRMTDRPPRGTPEGTAAFPGADLREPELIL